MKRFCLILLAAALSLFALPHENALSEEAQSVGKAAGVEAPSTPVTTKHLLKRCRLASNVLLGNQSLIYCTGYLGGALDMLRNLEAIKLEEKTLCAPPLPPNVRQKVFVDWAKNHPESHDAPASVSVQAAFSKAYPCRP